MNFFSKASNEPVEIFLVEDNLGDVYLMREALRRSHSGTHLEVANNGEEALAYLRHEGEHSVAQEPDLVLLDLNLPKMNGWEVLAQLKDDFRLKHIPVVILSGSMNPSDIRLAYRLNANGYIVKPMNLDHFQVLAKYLHDFWINNFQMDGQRRLI